MVYALFAETPGEGRAEVKQPTERCWDRSPGRSLGAPRVYKTYLIVTGYTISCSPLLAQADGLDPSSRRSKLGQLAPCVPRAQAQIEDKRVPDWSQDPTSVVSTNGADAGGSTKAAVRSAQQRAPMVLEYPGLETQPGVTSEVPEILCPARVDNTRPARSPQFSLSAVSLPYFVHFDN